ncbi:hypothetical protein ACN1NW_000450 [Acinetobacter baumannii]|nr:hypothetical protein [Acinetobacter baumannii]ELA7031034.1 hypothetical protein [Acinetobacter baumannii]ELA7118797.1 hypothetical protein [Acinetobacter baumannii]ELB0919746.1 hypothetical protein [Acinetobacter baumannii]ELB0965923.1 hypothetical protein [Acinetobacter baumannii]
MTAYTAPQLLKCCIIERAIENAIKFNLEGFKESLIENFPDIFETEDSWEVLIKKITPENVDKVYAEIEYEDDIYNARNEIREGEKTNLSPKNWSRNYEIDAVARQINGLWVVWDYYYGGGKHSNPEEIEWVEEARFADCKEEEVTVIKRTFTIKGDENAA